MTAERRRPIKRLLALAIVLASIVGMAIVVPIGAMGLGFYRHFVVPSESMMPTIHVGDRFIARIRQPADIVRGDIVLVDVRDTIYVSRVVALPGDTIALENGVIILNGQRVAQRRIGEAPTPGAFSGNSATLLEEQLPGEEAPHWIFDHGPGPADGMPPLAVPAGHYFLMSDNRDNAADSRVSREDFGLGGAVPLRDIVGRPWWHFGRDAGGTGSDRGGQGN